MVKYICAFIKRFIDYPFEIVSCIHVAAHALLLVLCVESFHHRRRKITCTNSTAVEGVEGGVAWGVGGVGGAPGVWGAKSYLCGH